MKVFEVWGELSLKDTLTKDLAAAQAKVNKFATGMQTTLNRAASNSGGVSTSINESIRQLTLSPYQKHFEEIEKKVNSFKDTATKAFESQVKSADAAGASVKQLTEIYNRYLSNLKEAERFGEMKKSTVSATSKSDLITSQENEFRKASEIRNKEIENIASFNARKESQIQSSIAKNTSYINSLRKNNDDIAKQTDEAFRKREEALRKQKELDFRQFEIATKKSQPKETSSDVAYNQAMKQNEAHLAALDSYTKKKQQQSQEIINIQKREADTLKKYSLDVQSFFNKNIDSQAASLKKYSLDVQSFFDKQIAAASKAKDKTAALNAAMGRLQRTAVAFAAVMAFKAVTNGLEQLIKPGIELNSLIEDSRLGIASLISAQAKIIDPFGKQLEGVEKFNAAIKISDDLIEQLRIDNLQTVATFDQLLRVFQQSVTVGLGAGFDLDQIRQFSVAITQTASAMQVPLDMLNEEVRALLTGAISQRSSIIATRLGLTPDMINKMRGDSQQFFDFLMNKMAAFKYVGAESQKTFSGLYSNMKDALGGALAQGMNPLFEMLKREMKGIIDNIVIIDEKSKTVSFNPQFLKDVYALDSAIRKTVKGLLLLWDLLGATIGQTTKLVIKPIDLFDNPKRTGSQFDILKEAGFDQDKIKIGINNAIKEFERFRNKAFPSMSWNPNKNLNTILDFVINRGSMNGAIQNIQKYRDVLAFLGEDTTKLDQYMEKLKTDPMYATESFRRLTIGLNDFKVSTDKALNADELKFGQKMMFALEEDDLKKVNEFVKNMSKSLGDLRTALYQTKLGTMFEGFPEDKMKIHTDYLRNITAAQDEYNVTMKKYKDDALEKNIAPERFMENYAEQIKKADDTLKKHKENIKSTTDIELRISAIKNYKSVLEKVQQSQKMFNDARRGYSAENVDDRISNLSSKAGGAVSVKDNLLSYLQEITSEYQELESNGTAAGISLKQEFYAVSQAVGVVDKYLDSVNSKIERMNSFKYQDMISQMNKILNQKDPLSEDQFSKVSSYLDTMNSTVIDYESNLAQVEAEMTLLANLPASRSMNEFFEKSNRMDELKSIADDLRSAMTEASGEEARYREQMLGRREEVTQGYMNQLISMRDILLGIKNLANVNLMVGFDQYDALETTLNGVVNKLYEVEKAGYDRSIYFNFLDGTGGPAKQGLIDITALLTTIPKNIAVKFEFGNALEMINSISSAFNNLKQMGLDFVMQFFTKASPVMPFTEGINSIIKRLNSLPAGSTYQVDFLMNKLGMSGSDATGYMDQNSKLQGLYSSYNKAIEAADYWSNAYNGLSFGNQAMQSYYQTAAETILGQISTLKTQMYASAADAYYNKMETSSSASSSSNTSGNSGGVSIQIGTIAINYSGGSREDAIRLADRIDEELAKKMKASDSKVLNTLRNGGVLS